MSETAGAHGRRCGQPFELVTCHGGAAAPIRPRFGNVIGSNIYNILGILGITALVRPIPIPPQIAELDVWIMLAATLH
jgi:hypothetical protein